MTLDLTSTLYQTMITHAKHDYILKSKYFMQEMLETSVLKQKQTRDKSISEMRQKFKNIKILNAFEERELKFRKQRTIFTFSESKPMVHAENKVGYTIIDLKAVYYY